MKLQDHQRLRGLVAATHTPFHTDGSLNLAIVEQQAAHLLANDVTAVFIGGTTGESSSLSLDERRSLAQRWMEVARGTAMRVIVHVGANALCDARVLAAEAQQHGAHAIAALSPSYFKPRSLDALVACAADIAAAAPATPFYFYDIPSMTGVSFPMADFLAQASERIPNLAGLKFTNPDLMSFQLCLHADGGAWDVPFGCDEFLLAALSLGATGAVGSTYNFAAPIYHRVMRAFAAGDFATARVEQFRSVQLVQLLAGVGFMGAAKAVMGMLGVKVGPARLPNGTPPPEQEKKLRADLDAMGFFDWIKR
jgi:N-acetylneuraminate lyase